MSFAPARRPRLEESTGSAITSIVWLILCVFGTVTSSQNAGNAASGFDLSQLTLLLNLLHTWRPTEISAKKRLLKTPRSEPNSHHIGKFCCRVKALAWFKWLTDLKRCLEHCSRH